MADTALGAAAPETSTNNSVDELASHDFVANMTMQQLHASEHGYDEFWRPKRRVALLSLTRSKAELVASFSKGDNGPELLMEMIQHVQDWAQHLRDGLEMAEAATARLSVACAAVMVNAEQTDTGA